MNTRPWITPNRKEELRRLAVRSHQVVLLAAVAGCLTGLFVAGFEEIVSRMVEGVLDLNPWVAAGLPLAGLLVAAALRRLIAPGAGPATTDEYLHAFHDARHRLGVREWLARVAASVATLGSGVPMGLEGPSLYSGATIGNWLQQRLPASFRGADRRVLMVSGAAAGVAAIFKAPATGAVFALEVPYQDDLARRMLLPSLVSSAAGYLTFAAVHGTSPLFPVDATPEFSFRDLGGAAALGIVAGIGARLFAWMIRRAKRLAAVPRPFLLALASGASLAGLFAVGRLLTGESLMLTSGYHVIAWASEPGHAWWLLLAILAARCVATSVAVAGGGVGGLFVPLVVAGALAGAAVGDIVKEADLPLFIVIGVASFLGAGYRVPLAAVMFVAETTGRPSFVVPGLIAAVAGELVMGASSVTTYQVSTMVAGSPAPRTE